MPAIYKNFQCGNFCDMFWMVTPYGDMINRDSTIKALFMMVIPGKTITYVYILSLGDVIDLDRQIDFNRDHIDF